MTDSILVATEKELRMYIENVGVDMLFECFVGLMLKSKEINQDKVHVIPFENFKRNYKNDLLEAPNESEAYRNHYLHECESGDLQLFTSRSCILDYLPEDFYAEPDNSDAKKNADGRTKTDHEIEVHRQYLKEHRQSALRFFRPLEIKYNQIRVQRELKEVELVEDKDPLLTEFWKKYDIATTAWERFNRTLHLTRYIVGDLKKTKALIEYVVQLPVALSYRIESKTSVTQEEIERHTGTEKILGFNVISGNSIYDYLEICELKIEGLNKKQFLEYYQSHSNERKLLEEIIKYYFPLNIEVRIDYSMNAISGDKEEEAVPVIGYSTILGKPL